MRGGRLSGQIALSLVWLLLVCYPDPRVLWRAIRYTITPPIDPEAVRSWARTLPDDPKLIEARVLERIQYAVPWQTSGVPWSVPSPAEALAAGAGDCQARALVLASVLAAKGIPYRLRASLDHMWVDYPAKQPNTLESPAKLLWERPPRDAHGRSAPAVRWHLPKIDWRESIRIEKEYFWDPAPATRKLALLAGLGLIWILGWRALPSLTPVRTPQTNKRPSDDAASRHKAPLELGLARDGEGRQATRDGGLVAAP